MGDRDAVCRFSAGKGGNQQRAADGDERQGDQTRRIVAEEGIDLNANQRREEAAKCAHGGAKADTGGQRRA